MLIFLSRVISTIASYVDTTTLHELSRTCRQFRANLLEHRATLIDQTLRCTNENANPALRLGDALQASFQQWTDYARTGEKVGRVSGGKVGACARDMVGACRKCGVVVCRVSAFLPNFVGTLDADLNQNCVMKQPTANVVKGRVRRLCRKCMKSSIEPHTVTKVTSPCPPTAYAGSQHESSDYEFDDKESSTQVTREPCTCDDLPWICRPCSQSVRTADTTYLRGWVWRTRYSKCGGIGAGLGEGNEGVECGRGGECLDAQKVEKEIECDCDELAAIEAELESNGVDGRTWSGSSYTTVEVVGIGGRVKKKVKKSVMVGGIVKEYEDERLMKVDFLKREQEKQNRSWCSWCDRVVLSKKDAEVGMRSTDSISSVESGQSVSP